MKQMIHLTACAARTGGESKDAKDARDKRIFASWLACHTQQEIADAEGIPLGTVPGLVDGFLDFGNLAESKKAAANHATDFEPPIYNVWKQQGKTPGSPWLHGGSATR